MPTFVVLAALGIAAGAVVWIVFVLRKYRARKVFEREREARFVAEMLQAKSTLAKSPAPAPAAAPPPSPAAAPGPGAPADPLSAAAAAIKAALTSGRSAEAAKAFLAVVAERTRLTLEPPVWEGLGRALLAQGAHMEAAWALHAGAALAGDLVGAQKRLVEVAVRAGDAGQAHSALKLYATLLAKYPQSQYADFVRANMKEQEKRLPKAGA
jgi:predicted Zn-dependent protease